jgi:hypothetical protein
MQEEKLNGGGHVSETIGWLAIYQGSADDGDTLLQVATTGDVITDNPSPVTFAQPFAGTSALIAKLTSFDGPDLANLRFSSLSASGFTAIAAEEQSLDTELIHTTGRAGYLALAGRSGTIEGLTV